MFFQGFCGSDWVFLAIFLIAPFFSSLVITLLSLVKGEGIPPTLPQINAYSLGQAFVTVIAAVMISRTINGRGIDQYAVMDVVIIGTSLLGVLTLVLLAQAVIERRWQTKTQDHARDVFDSRVRPHLKPGLSAELLMRMAGYLIDADFFPESIANRLSDMPRRKRRGSFIELIRECCSDNDEIRGLAEDVFLLPLEERTTLRRAYGAVLVASLLLYSLSIFLFFSVTRPT